MRVFLAGGTGHVGGGILQELLRQGHEATLLGRHAPEHPLDRRVRFVEGDVTRPGSWTGQVAGHEACVNAVGIIRDRGGNTFQRVVVDGTKHLLGACWAGGVPRFVQISANGIEPAIVPYQKTKLEGEALVKASGLAYTIFRPSIVYGPTDSFTTPVARAMRWGAVPYLGRGDYRLAPVALSDLASAVVKGLGNPAAMNQTFHVCGPESLAYKDVLGSIREAAGRRALLVPVPKWMGFTGAALLGWIPWFPATTDMLRMLVRGNKCPDQEWARVFRITPAPFAEGLQEYLGRPGPASAFPRESHQRIFPPTGSRSR